MTRDDIKRMAREAGGCFEELPLCDAWLFYEDEHLERFATLVAAEKDKEIKRLQDLLYTQLGELTALRAEKQMRERIKEIKEVPR